MEGTATTAAAIPSTAAAAERDERLAAQAARRRRRGGALTHAILLLGVFAVVFPIWIALVGSTHDASTIGRGDVPLLPGGEAVENYAAALAGSGGGRFRSSPAALMLWNSALMAVLIACGKIAISLLSAYAVAFFSFPGRMIAFWTIFLTLMLPVEVRTIPTYQVIVGLDLFDSVQGLTAPLMASPTAPLLLRQFFL